ncbi:MAG: EpsG family protein [Muribaculaceae bacterium]|nr:EpsG family protein [Muribaculaceae bacterium]
MQAELYFLRLQDAPVWNIAYQVFFHLLYLAVIIYLLCPAMRRRDRIVAPEYFNKGKWQRLLPGLFLAVVTWIFIGFYPTDIPSDRVIYARQLQTIIDGGSFSTRDYGGQETLSMLGTFDPLYRFLVLHVSPYIGSVVVFMAIWGLIYVGCYYEACRRMAPDHVFLLFLVVAGSLFFFGYGVSALRQGVGEALVLLAFVLPRRRWWLTLLLMICAVMIHFSLLLPCIAFWIGSNFKRTDILCYIWLAVAVLSFFIGPLVTKFILSMPSIDPRVEAYLDPNGGGYDLSYFIGFRLDFILYSAIAIVAGIYYIYRRKYDDAVYTSLINTYLLIMTAWLFLIRIPYTDRIAHLGWMLAPVILFLPLLGRKQLTTAPASAPAIDRVLTPQVIMVLMMVMQLTLKYVHIRLVF